MPPVEDEWQLNIDSPAGYFNEPTGLIRTSEVKIASSPDLSTIWKACAGSGVQYEPLTSIPVLFPLHNPSLLSGGGAGGAAAGGGGPGGRRGGGARGGAARGAQP